MVEVNYIGCEVGYFIIVMDWLMEYFVDGVI